MNRPVTTTDLERVALDALDELGKELGNDIVPGSMLEAKLYHLEQAIRTLFRAAPPAGREQDTAAQDQVRSGDSGLTGSAAPAVPLPEEQINRMREAGKAGYLDMWNPAWDMLCNQAISAIRLQAQLEEARLQRDSHAFERLAAERTVGELTDALAACVSSLDHLMAFKGSRLEETQREGHLLNIKRGRAALARKEGT